LYFIEKRKLFIYIYKKKKLILVKIAKFSLIINNFVWDKFEWETERQGLHSVLLHHKTLKTAIQTRVYLYKKTITTLNFMKLKRKFWHITNTAFQGQY